MYIADCRATFVDLRQCLIYHQLCSFNERVQTMTALI